MDRAALAALIGRPYLKGGMGPDAFDCYGFARFVLINFHGVPAAHLAVGSDGGWDKVFRGARRRLRPLTAAECPHDGDMVLAGSASIGTHVGVVISTPAQPFRIAHALEEAGGVIADPLHIFQFRGFAEIRFYTLR